MRSRSRGRRRSVDKGTCGPGIQPRKNNPPGRRRCRRKREAPSGAPISRGAKDAADLLRATASDYANFVVSVMCYDQITKEIAAQRLVITRNLTSPENDIVLCESSADPDHCHVSTGFGLGWRIVKINDDVILDHTGGDADVKTLALFLPQQRTGAVIFTNGPDVGHQIIDKILAVL